MCKSFCDSYDQKVTMQKHFFYLKICIECDVKVIATPTPSEI